MKSNYYDTSSVLQIIGSVLKKPSILDYTDKYSITEDDFVEDFHKIVFGTVYKLYESGAKDIGLTTIADFLESKPNSRAIYENSNGPTWVLKAKENADETNFDYYYARLKKMTLLRMYDSYGIDVKDIYDPDNILDMKKRARQESQLDNYTLEQIAEEVDKKISEIKMKYVDNSSNESVHAGQGIDELLDRLEETPDYGVPLFGSINNSVLRGARLKKFYLRSAATGVGKSRMAIADACTLGCSKYYDDTMCDWVSLGNKESTLFITTEQELEEIQTMMLAFISCVNEEHIIDKRFVGDERDRVRIAAQIIKDSSIFVETLPDFSLLDIENTIKRNIREHNCSYIFMDYIHSSLKILEEITKRSGGVKLREDNVLFMLGIRLKDLCNEYGVFLMSSTQLNGNWPDAETPDQNLLRGAKSLADKIDVGEIALPVNEKDKEKIRPILEASGYTEPKIKISVYKNRRGPYKGVYLWCKADLGVCRVEPLFATTWNYELIQIEDIKINVVESPWDLNN